MGVADFVQQGVSSMMIARPKGAEGQLVYRIPKRELDLFAQIDVGQGDSAVFVDMGMMLGALGPGRHVLSAERMPFLAPHILADKHCVRTELLFIFTAPQPLRVGGTFPGLREPSGRVANYRFGGTVHVQVIDPAHLVISGMADLGEGLIQMLRSRLMQGIGKALQELMSANEIAMSDPHALGQALSYLARAPGHTQGGFGIHDYGMAIAGVEVASFAPEGAQPGAGVSGTFRRPPAPPDAGLDTLREAPTPPGTSQPGVRKPPPIPPGARKPAPPASPSPPSPPSPSSPPSQPISARFSADDVCFYDTVHELPIRVTVLGHLVGDPIEDSKEPWVAQLITHTLTQAAHSWTGPVVDLLPQRISKWADYLTQSIAPHLRYYLSVEGKVVIEDLRFHPEDLAKLERKKAQRA